MATSADAKQPIGIMETCLIAAQLVFAFVLCPLHSWFSELSTEYDWAYDHLWIILAVPFVLFAWIAVAAFLEYRGIIDAQINWSFDSAVMAMQGFAGLHLIPLILSFTNFERYAQAGSPQPLGTAVLTLAAAFAIVIGGLAVLAIRGRLVHGIVWPLIGTLIGGVFTLI